MKINGAAPSRDMLKQMIRGIPDEAPYYNRIYVDSRGFIYVFRSRWENTRGPKIDLFSSRGIYLYASTLVLPDGLTLKSRPAFYRDTMVAFVEDEDGEGRLAMFKIALPAE